MRLEAAGVLHGLRLAPPPGRTRGERLLKRGFGGGEQGSSIDGVFERDSGWTPRPPHRHTRDLLHLMWVH